MWKSWSSIKLWKRVAGGLVEHVFIDRFRRLQLIGMKQTQPVVEVGGDGFCRHMGHDFIPSLEDGCSVVPQPQQMLAHGRDDLFPGFVR